LESLLKGSTTNQTEKDEEIMVQHTSGAIHLNAKSCISFLSDTNFPAVVFFAM